MVEPTTAKAPSASSPQEHVFNIILGFWQSRALAVAAELELADLLLRGPLSVDELAAKTKTDPSSLFRLLRALESIGIFAQVAPTCSRIRRPAHAFARGIPPRTGRLLV